MTPLEQWESDRRQAWAVFYAARLADKDLTEALAVHWADFDLDEWKKRFPKPTNE